MTAVSEIPERPAPRAAGMRAYARLGEERRYPAGPRSAPAAEEAVTFDKIGDFLELDLRRFAVWLRSGLLAIVLLGAVGAVSGAIYSMLAKPRYAVTTDVMIDPANLQLFDANLFATQGQFDNALLFTGSKVRVLTSRNVLERVVTQLDLASDPEFYDPNGFDLKSMFGASKAAGDPVAAATEALGDHVGTKLDEKSFVVSLSVSSESTSKAIAISAAMIEAFKAELDASEADSASRAAAALDQRLTELRRDVQRAEVRVEAFRRDNNLASSNGQLVTSQSLTQLNTDFVAAQSRAAAAQANYEALLSGDANARSDTVGSTLTALRDRAGVAQQQLSAAAMTYGPLHPRITSLKAELAVVNGQIENELKRMVATAKGEADQAAAVVAALTAQMQTLTADTFVDSDLQVELRELERDATAKAAVYENFLARQQQVAELEQISTTNVRTISTAVPPEGRSWPPGVVVMAMIGGIGGAILGIVLAVLLGLRRDLRKPRAAAA
jgi:uncharacterized protein involved in exopolysaccharide biosynthesis